ncbi:LuxR C-terminal-related transcriptional regulator [Variovorax sp. dw_308]|uniref:LuxR C-terminal-related transcriptional regulator n=1 Tax=Variovorax sp. dw_308 TaxID=2721546 RepID=UPI001C49334C|nr:LuxR C-terminal-related transcriptional regulator [Variovorax sp. dw_308]
MPSTPNAVLPAKLSAPTLSRAQLERLEVADRIGSAGPVRLIVLRAPAGFGKTTAMLQHAARCAAAGMTTAWLNLDESDNDLTRFLLHFEAAITSAGAIAAADAHDASVFGMLARVGGSRREFTLFLDDFEVIQSSTVLDLLRQVLDNMPPQWRIVIGSRTVPSLGLGRLRAHGRVLEIGLEQLRFTRAEAHDFLCTQRGLVLSDALVDRLYQATEGWITALWLASVALQDHDDPEAFLQAFSGNHAAITEYLAEDVLARQAEPVRDFLLRTSVLSYLSAPLCDAVLERDDSHAMLAQLERSNLFLMPADAQRETFRFHALFAEFLRTQLAQRDPEAASALHLRAARYFEAQGRAVPAIAHALRARDHAVAVQLLKVHGPMLLHKARFRLLSRWLGGLPATELQAQPGLLVVYAWALAFTHRHHEALALLQDPRNWTPPADKEEAESLQAHLLALRPMVLTMMDNSEGVPLAIHNHALIDPRHDFPYGALTNTLAMLFAALNRVDEARVLLEQARRAHHRIDSTFSLVVSECIEGTIRWRQGHLQDALARFRIAMNNMTLEASGRVDGNPNAAVYLAAALYEAGQLEEAERALVSSLPLLREVGQLAHIVVGYITLSRIAWHRGEAERAFGILGELEYLGHQDQAPRLASSAELERSRLSLLRGDVKGATHYLGRAQDPKLLPPHPEDLVPLHDVESPALAGQRLRLRSGKAVDAIGELAKAITSARDEANHRLALVLELLHAEALQRAGQSVEARAAISRTLEAVAVEGIVQPFADEGPVVAGLAQWWCRTFASKKLPAGVAANFVERLERACAGVTADDEEDDSVFAAPAAEGASFDALTFREIHVLKLLSRGQANSAIAEALFVSENTVRTHLRNIFSKLGAHNRTEAASIARKHKLLE